MLTFPGADEGFIDGSRYLVEGSFIQGMVGGSSNSATHGRITLFIDKADGTSSAVHTSVAEAGSIKKSGINNVSKILTINIGDKLRISADSAVTGNLNGTKLNN